MNEFQVVWARSHDILGQGSLSTSGDERISVYRSDDEYTLNIENATAHDAGTYTILIDGLGIEQTFEVEFF